MRSTNVFVSVALLFGLSAPDPSIAQDSDSTLSEARTFMAEYGAALLAGGRDRIGNLYHPDGAYIASTEFRFHASLDAIRRRYLERWSPPDHFEWCDLRYDVLSPDVVNVPGYFNWTDAEAATRMSYCRVPEISCRDGAVDSLSRQGARRRHSSAMATTSNAGSAAKTKPGRQDISGTGH